MGLKQNSSDSVDLHRPTIFAHRGSSAQAPENTLAAFELAVKQGAHAIELDAKLSSDGYAVVMHDNTVDRTTNGTGRVSELTLAELTSLDAGSKFSPQFSSQKVPSLDKVFETVGGKIFINVELTNYWSSSDYLPDTVVSLVKKHSLESSILLSSYNIIALIRARSLLTKIPLGFLTHRGEAEAALRSRLVQFGSLMALHPDCNDVTQELVKNAHHLSCRIHTYTVDQPEAIARLLALGVDGIFTNNPQAALKVLPAGPLASI